MPWRWWSPFCGGLAAEAMLSALTRVLKEDYKKNQTLALNIMQIFFKYVAGVPSLPAA